MAKVRLDPPDIDKEDRFGIKHNGFTVKSLTFLLSYVMVKNKMTELSVTFTYECFNRFEGTYTASLSNSEISKFQNIISSNQELKFKPVSVDKYEFSKGCYHHRRVFEAHRKKENSGKDSINDFFDIILEYPTIPSENINLKKPKKDEL